MARNRLALGVLYNYGNTIYFNACYYSQGSNSYSNVMQFSNANWPLTTTHTQWGIGDGSGDGKYWQSLGAWNGGSPVYPKLWYEQ